MSNLEMIELSAQDCELLDQVRRPNESYSDCFRRVLQSVEIVEDVAAEGGVQHPYNYE